MADLTKKLLAVTAIGLPSYKLFNGPYTEPVHCASHFKTISYQLLTVTDLQLTKCYTGPRTWTNLWNDLSKENRYKSCNLECEGFVSGQ
jgi:hypothetical protein